MTWAIENKGYSQRRACGLVGIEPRVYRYRSSRPEDAGRASCPRVAYCHCRRISPSHSCRSRRPS